MVRAKMDRLSLYIPPVFFNALEFDQQFPRSICILFNFSEMEKYKQKR
jgi:hypothetical protein